LNKLETSIDSMTGYNGMNNKHASEDGDKELDYKHRKSRLEQWGQINELIRGDLPDAAKDRAKKLRVKCLLNMLSERETDHTLEGQSDEHVVSARKIMNSKFPDATLTRTVHVTEDSLFAIPVYSLYLPDSNAHIMFIEGHAALDSFGPFGDFQLAHGPEKVDSWKASAETICLIVRKEEDRFEKVTKVEKFAYRKLCIMGCQPNHKFFALVHRMWKQYEGSTVEPNQMFFDCSPNIATKDASKVEDHYMVGSVFSVAGSREAFEDIAVFIQWRIKKDRCEEWKLTFGDNALWEWCSDGARTWQSSPYTIGGFLASAIDSGKARVGWYGAHD